MSYKNSRQSNFKLLLNGNPRTYFLFLAGLCALWASISQAQIDENFDFNQLGKTGITVIENPAISRRCYKITQQRKEKISMKQRLQALIERNSYLQKVTPKNKEIALTKLRYSMQHLIHENKITRTKIKDLEEEIIRKGCPPINLTE